ncbi:pyridoxamine 5'-phosphate oxidase family protein [Clostridium sp. MB40-C1]|uniref:pyridoxamine 5'-phosphate oxidase family protein n=1 Tax=Clostridium sp. MB40-C1 TaxID=3070996 RepID=UPI0027E0C363|nr:pyridoxamine 5'-phosphate oxidase family protein [Clostridium sp. MB40-C1]WMJ82226.1 pyridoxamine 5'-phosphate oxidase family protein [Clostridium sp. MB40-C1]
MNKLIDYLNENRMGHLATIKDGKPVMRPFQFQFEKEGKFYFVTGNTKEVYKQLKISGVAGFIVTGKDMRWVRLNGEIEFVNNLKLKEAVINNESLIRDIYKTADNPVFEMFYIHRGVVSFHEAEGELIEEIQI